MTLLKTLRTQKGLTQLQAAFQLRVDDSTLAKAESGLKRISTRTMERIARFYGVPEEQLFEESGYARKN